MTQSFLPIQQQDYARLHARLEPVARVVNPWCGPDATTTPPGYGEEFEELRQRLDRPGESLTIVADNGAELCTVFSDELAERVCRALGINFAYDLASKYNRSDRETYWLHWFAMRALTAKFVYADCSPLMQLWERVERHTLGWIEDVFSTDMHEHRLEDRPVIAMTLPYPGDYVGASIQRFTGRWLRLFFFPIEQDGNSRRGDNAYRGVVRYKVGPRGFGFNVSTRLREAGWLVGLDGFSPHPGSYHRDGEVHPPCPDSVAWAVAEVCRDPIRFARDLGKLTGQCGLCSTRLLPGQEFCRPCDYLFFPGMGRGERARHHANIPPDTLPF